MFCYTIFSVFMLAISANAQNGTMMVDSNNTMTDAVTSPMMMENTTMMVPVDVPADNDTTTSGPDAPVTPAPVMDTTTTQPEATTPMIVDVDTTTMPPVDTTTQKVPCNDSIGRLDEIFDFTSTALFADMSANEQILIYEVLAAAEGCKMSSFMNAETAERIFRMLGSLPVRYVYIMLNYMAEALANEGVVVPV